jgi:uncharacterized membrane protein
MKKYLSTGFIILLPIALTVWIIAYLFNLFTDPLFNIVEKLLVWYEARSGILPQSHETLVAVLGRLLAFIFTFLIILGLGYVGRKFFFKKILLLAHYVMDKIPVVGTIYRLTKDITHAVFTTDQKAFKETVLIPFPAGEMHTLGFITGQVPEALREVVPSAEVTVFVPTAPHPISGYVLFASKSAIFPVTISVEETFKFLLSCGVIRPEDKKE